MEPGLPLVAVSGGYSSCSAKASHCGGFSCCGARAVGCAVFISCGFWALEHRLNGCGTRAWDHPRPGIEPMSLALVSGFFTTEPPGKPPELSFFGSNISCLYPNENLSLYGNLLSQSFLSFP